VLLPGAQQCGWAWPLAWQAEPPLQHGMDAGAASLMAALGPLLGAAGAGGLLQGAPSGGAQSPAAAASALAQLISGLATALGGVQQQQQQQQQHDQYHQPQQQHFQQSPLQQQASAAPELRSPDGGSSLQFTVGVPSGAASVEEFVAQNALEPWVSEALYLLNDEQRAHVMRNQLNLDNTTNLNGVVTSRIKEVANVEQRLQMFIQLNGLAEGVVDRLSTLTPDQHEKVMESTLIIQKANNPSGVAMRRISDVLRNERMGVSHGPHMSSPGYRDHGSRPASHHHDHGAGSMSSQAASLTNALSTLVESLGGNAGRRDDRSRSRPLVAAMGAGSGNVPRDIQGFVSEYALEGWCGEVLARLSLWQRQNVMKELGNMNGVRNPSGVVMARVKQVANTSELLTIFIDINQIDNEIASELWALPEEHQAGVMAPGIFIQNARGGAATRSRIRNVLAGQDAMGGARRHS